MDSASAHEHSADPDLGERTLTQDYEIVPSVPTCEVRIEFAFEGMSQLNCRFFLPVDHEPLWAVMSRAVCERFRAAAFPWAPDA